MNVSTPARPGSRTDRGAERLLRALAAVGADRRHGARGLAGTTLAAIARTLAAWELLPPDDPRRYCRAIARALGTSQPAMGPFQQWSLEWARIARTVPSERLVRSLRKWARERAARWRDEPNRIAATVRRLFPPDARVVTISRSDSVRRALESLPRGRRPAEVIALESRPGGEGGAFARDLRRSGVRAQVVPDLAGRRAAGRADLVLLGADAVYADGSVVHKVGTRPLALAARHAGVAVVVVVGTLKGVERRRPSRPLGPLFDRTPARLVSAYWTDRGAFPGGQWSRAVRTGPQEVSSPRRERSRR